MVGRWLCAITYVVALPAVTMLLEFVVGFLSGSATASWGESCRQWIPAGLLVGSLALLVEHGLYRFAGTWPKSGLLYFFRAVIFGTIYVTLVIEVGLVFSGRPIGSISLGEIRGLFRDFWLILIAAAPFGLLLGVGQMVLLRPRAPDTLAAAVGLGMLAVLVFAPWLGD